VCRLRGHCSGRAHDSVIKSIQLVVPDSRRRHELVEFFRNSTEQYLDQKGILARVDVLCVHANDLDV